MPRNKFEFTDKHAGLIEAYARTHCTDEEIAAEIGCSERTLQRHYRDLLHRSRKRGVAGIRAKQYALAMKGDKTMLIWVGKQIAGQSEKRQETQDLTAHVVQLNKLNGDKTIYQTEFRKKKPE